MRVLITGAAGFIGSQLTTALLARGTLTNVAGKAEPIEEIILADTAPIVLPAAREVAVRAEVGDCCDLGFLQHLFDVRIDSIFPLAASLTTEAEANFALGIKVNVLGLLQLLEMCRERRDPARLVYASSIATFGGPLPAVVDDAVVQTPQTSYGTHKAIAELLINDYARHDFIDGRVLRLPIVLIRPGAPSPAVSDRVAAVVREPLRGQDVICPFQHDTRLPVVSARRVAQALIAVHELAPNAFAHTRAMNLPALTVSVGQMIEALDRAGRGGRLGHVRFVPDARLQAIVDGWPKEFVSERAARYGIVPDASFDDVIRAFLEDYPNA